MLTMILGTMKAGKSAKLIDEAFNILFQDEVIIIRPSCDTREFFTRKYKNDELKRFNFGNENTSLSLYRFIFVDEIQFFKKDFLEQIINLSRKKEITITVAGLLNDVKGNAWDNVETLKSYADEILYLKADCDCCGKKESAIFHIGDGGINNNYFVFCEECYKM
ncbi:thymidine kinase [Campylobacter coli]|uniref:thymidine kinase n=1 Tax=Campylobacter coli TaxID=195 RepID=UPI0018FE0956|nr:thymidine kinase [Campylobacter coli]